MYLDVPRLKRCCLCVPLRYGVLTYAYLSLVLSILSVVEMCCDINQGYGYLHAALPYRLHTFRVNSFVLLVVHLLDTISNVLLIFGGHKKNVLLMKIYYYYGLSTILTAFVFDITFMFYDYNRIMLPLIIFFFSLIIEGYLLLIVKSEIEKLQTSHPVRFVNQLTDIIVGDSHQPMRCNESKTEKQQDSSATIEDTLLLN